MHPYDTWQTFGATGKNTSSRGSGDYVYAHGGDPNWAPDDPTFKAWFAKNATRQDVMESSGNTDALKDLFLTDVEMDELPVFSDEIDSYGNVDKSGRDIETSFKMLDQYRNGGRP